MNVTKKTIIKHQIFTRTSDLDLKSGGGSAGVVSPSPPWTVADSRRKRRRRDGGIGVGEEEVETNGVGIEGDAFG